jgi:SOS-response transcriptional repressor LexA
MKLSEVLDKLMLETNIDSVQLAKCTNVPVTTIARIRTNQNANPTISTLIPVAHFFNISIDQLLGIQPLPSDRIPSTYNPVNYTSTLIPILGWDDVLKFLNSKQEFLKGRLLHWVSSERDLSKNAFALNFTNNNANLFLKNGSIILIEPKQIICNNNFALFVTSGNKRIELYQVVLDGDDTYIKSTNPEISSIKLLPESFVFLGSVVEIRFAFQQSSTSKPSKVKGDTTSS